MPSETITLAALDGRPLAATIHSPEGPPRAALVVLGALGVPRRYYASFAASLTGRGVAVLTFDYRGNAGSRTVPLRKDPATLLDWAQLDASAAIDLALARWGEVPVWGLGHSFGGQAIGLSPRGLDLAGAIVVAAGSGDLDLYPPALRRRFRVGLGLLLPLLSATLGYVPGRVGVGQDLPSGVMRQWARWCLTPDYARGALGRDATFFHRITAPMFFYDFTDDTYAPARPSAALRGWYERAQVTHKTIAPADLGVAAIGHFGGFRSGLAEPVWREIADAVLGEPRPLHPRPDREQPASDAPAYTP